MIAKYLLSCLTFLAFGISNEALADIYLNGGIASRVNPITGANDGEPFEFDSFDTPNSRLFFNGINQTSFLLTSGENTFTVSGHASDFLGLGLFFTPTATQLKNATDFGRAPDLDVFATGGGFSVPLAGTQVATIGQFSGNTAYSGAASFSIGAESVSVSSWNGTTLKLNVSAVPEPSSIALCLIACYMCAYRPRNRIRYRDLKSA